jgi:hypothetical protein
MTDEMGGSRRQAERLPYNGTENRPVDLSDLRGLGVQVRRVMMRQFSQTNGYCQVS